jgi:hypothetical protein
MSKVCNNTINGIEEYSPEIALSLVLLRYVGLVVIGVAMHDE